MSLKRIDLLICCGSGCVSAGALKIKERFHEVLKEHNITNEVNIIETGCMGPCDYGPVMVIYPEGIFYKKVTPDDVAEIVSEHFVKGRPVARLMLQEEEKTFSAHKDIPFYQKQVKVALENCGYIDPESLDEYIATGGYEALGTVLTEMKPQDAINIIKESGLRGRGGGGFPTHIKWQMVHDAKADQKYIICNGDEGDPGAFMDRSLLEGDPHRILEGMMIAAYCMGASNGFFYIRAEYPLAIKRIKMAIQQAKELGLMGNDIFGSGFNFDAEVRTGAGAFVCGEEMALIHSIEGLRGNPTPKPPYPAVQGLWGKPTVVNNVETIGNIATIIRKGAAWFASMGTEKSKGTKVFALTGDVKNTGLVEVPMGITLRELIFDVGGGMIGDHKFKAVQLGGPSGGCLTAEHLDTAVDYENLKERGAMMGSGGVIVMNDEKCMVNVAKFFMDFCVEESCGKCSPCRIGLKQMLEILERITSGKGKEGDIEELQRLGESISKLSLCGLGQTAPNPVLSTIRYFRDEYESHIRDHSCSTKVCSDLMHFNIDKERCIGCSLCARKCPTNCITGSREEKYTIHQLDCIKCGNCFDVCPVKAIDKIPGMHPEVETHRAELAKAAQHYDE
ncbi:MAG: NADH-ubiquinone oxidoreductase-F iron-sulfur binding region domain-containing protein [Candidatus Cloacimonetes bacterium]|jgi:NADP-reducing hydrogenase subunit HndC|nr:NADH-ubiquinone oxidoreductase-F iron-sulfur binding region domain-containing protein [Candidatus Cloacimonadota bacterium]MDD4232457.1 NADH-ubiquinone oxidoreductase-F iron-sulfur binding region domain-containing protein [Candidatus Cloacimonadota bacterium]MDD4687108.1 NADH-ubiquinone oxidoreductase-F iron-sulfur binding region domain-containing protein [Candidatus Cloacimonadota bacterium]MDY0298420.1 NADH-ubiquinone oxidoreductase-F iron-sulfur binding region domain-containing protein [Ca